VICTQIEQIHKVGTGNQVTAAGIVLEQKSGEQSMTRQMNHMVRSARIAVHVLAAHMEHTGTVEGGGTVGGSYRSDELSPNGLCRGDQRQLRVCRSPKF
jgi:hypothetical protein